MPIAIAICDNEKHIRDEVKHLIKNQHANCHIDLYDSGNSLLSANINYNIYILDIRMPGINGIKTAELIRERQKAEALGDSIIIFVSELIEYMAYAFDVKAYHYLMKPINEKKFNAVLSRAINDCYKIKNHMKNYVLFKSGNSYHKLFFKDIFYVESHDKKIIINSTYGVVEYYGKMQALENTFGSSFFRCHRCYIANMEHIIRYNANTIWLKNGSKVFLAQKKYTAFVKAFMFFTQTTDAHMESFN